MIDLVDEGLCLDGMSTIDIAELLVDFLRGAHLRGGPVVDMDVAYAEELLARLQKEQ